MIFFCKQKTAYELRISDLSSDVCSSDLSGDAEIWNDRFARLLRRRSALAEALRLFRAGCANAVGGSGRMKFTLSWLKDHLETNATVDEIVGTLTRIGLAVEGVENPADRKSDV